MVETELAAEDSSASRRLIIIVVEPGEDPVVETDPPESFVVYEIIAALKRAIEMIEEDAIFANIEESDDE